MESARDTRRRGDARFYTGLLRGALVAGVVHFRVGPPRRRRSASPVK